MARRNTIPNKTLRLLYAHSGNCCAFEGYHNPIFEDDGTLTGECCHIEAYSKDGPRYNEQQTDEERNGYGNLVFMCHRHHKIIDSHPEQYTVEKLKTIKKSHENKYSAQHLEATDTMLLLLQKDSERYWTSLHLMDKMDDSGFKMELGENDIYSLMENIKETYECLQNNINSVVESSRRLQEDLIKECDKCGIDYSSFDKIPYTENSLVCRDWESVNLAFPNCMAMLKTRYCQLCVNLLEKLVVYNQDYLDLLYKCKNELNDAHKSAYYID